MKQQDALRSSSYRRESSPAPENLHAKKIGCMSAILRLVSKNQNRRRFITFGKKQGKISDLETSPTNEKQASPSSSSPKQQTSDTEDHGKFTRDVPRSPTLPAEIRRGTNLPPLTPLVARLMGLEDISNSATAAAKVETTVAEKRHILLGALQKCDEDLKALKKMIEVAKSSVSDQKGSNGDDNQLQPSPVSVLDDYFSSSTIDSGYLGTCNTITGHNERKKKKKKKPVEEGMNLIITNPSFRERITTPEMEMIQENEEMMIMKKMTSSKAMLESVEEVCRDISWGERREIGRIGLGLQDHICRDLIEEVVRDMSPSSASASSSSSSQEQLLIPFQSCKRSLRF
ncbi:hypothetical protein K2173_009898 [Erythroxylum novogranatense]|uniref:DUF3741 domain-containing protein n=1 Tax=Erythroxylum novogranatense TaxID=1862640 RepID=A0AAV8SZG2_9ROSI|nr:hypothetical protein K2173_009898 [Erythroxylum novogranatense]